MRRAALLVTFCASCSSGMSHAVVDGPRPVDASVDPTVLRVDGQYATAVTLQQNTCQGITVQSMPTTVAHTPGATDLTLTHAGQTYAGTVQRNGTFATVPRSVGTTQELHTITISGQFSTTGFVATVSAAVSHNGTHDCDYTVGWVGTKDGEPNVIPG
ncbi:MAG TPA: hypothetical protein VKE22_20440 [Haliangiales bacterium]|nr:hypothetical protein [Haliangiales bacterium]